MPYGDLFNDTDESIHLERHTFVLTYQPLTLTYSLNDVVFCTLNTLNLFSIERTRTENSKYSTDATTYSADGADLFIEKEWKGLLEPIPYGPQAVSLDIGF